MKAECALFNHTHTYMAFAHRLCSCKHIHAQHMRLSLVTYEGMTPCACTYMCMHVYRVLQISTYAQNVGFDGGHQSMDAIVLCAHEGFTLFMYMFIYINVWFTAHRNAGMIMLMTAITRM